MPSLWDGQEAIPQKKTEASKDGFLNLMHSKSTKFLISVASFAYPKQKKTTFLYFSLL
jgi:hypothetical protein